MTISRTYIELLKDRIERYTRKIAEKGVPTEEYQVELARLQAYRDCLNLVTDAENETKEEQDGPSETDL